MKIKTFLVEQWMNEHENDAKYNLAETCVDSVSIDELLELCGVERTAFADMLLDRRLGYGHIWGNPRLKAGIKRLYENITEDDIVTTHGAIGANHLVFYSLVSPGDRVVSVMPTYQQLYSIPEGFGADVKILHLTPENGYLPDMAQLREYAQGAKLICINNPNNPSGALMPPDMMQQIVDIARAQDAYVLCDEVYRGLTQHDGYQRSVVDMYEKGISVSSMSKVFSLAGLRLGWFVTRDKAAMESCLEHRDYNTISCGVLEEEIAALAVENYDKLLERSLKIVRGNLEVLDKWVAGQPHISYVKPQAGTTALLHYDFDIPSYDFCIALIDKTGVFFTPGDCFGQPHCVRIGYACSEEDLTLGLEIFGNYLKTLE